MSLQYEKLCRILCNDAPALNNKEYIASELMQMISNYSHNSFIKSNKLNSTITKLTEEVIDCINNGTITINDIFYKSIYEIIPSKIEEKNKMIMLMQDNMNTKSLSLFICPKCKARDHTMVEVQLRALDENSNHICTCNVCGCIWSK